MCIEVFAPVKDHKLAFKGVSTSWPKAESRKEANKKQTGSKQEANRRQTGGKQEANRRQTGGKQEANRMQTGCKRDAKGMQKGCKWDAKGCKRDANRMQRKTKIASWMDMGSKGRHRARRHANRKRLERQVPARSGRFAAN
jgi:hypothetical protein